jgi:hypothetical protein
MLRDVNPAVFVLLCFVPWNSAMQLDTPAMLRNMVVSAPDDSLSTQTEGAVAEHIDTQVWAANATFPLESGLYLEGLGLFEHVFANKEEVFAVNVDLGADGGEGNIKNPGVASFLDELEETHSAEVIDLGDKGIPKGGVICRGALHHKDFHQGHDKGIKAECGVVSDRQLARRPQSVLFATISGDGDHEIASQQIAHVANENMLVVLSGGDAVEKVFSILSKSTKGFMVTKSGQDTFGWLYVILFVVMIAAPVVIAAAGVAAAGAVAVAAAAISVTAAVAGALTLAVIAVAKATAYAAMMAAAAAASAAIGAAAFAGAVVAATAAIATATAAATTATGIGLAIYAATHRRRQGLPTPTTNAEEPAVLDAVCHELLDLDLSRLTHSNLGGLGPHDGDELIRYEGVANADGKTVDLVIMAIGEYALPVKDKHESNGQGGSIKKIFQKSGTSLELQFSFVDASTGKPHVMENVQFSFMDIDGFPNGEVEENILVCDATDVCLTEDTAVEDVGLDDDNCRWYKPKALQGYKNPTELDQMDDVQKAHSLTVKLQQSAAFRLVSKITNGNKNRPLLFAGKGVACPGKTCHVKTQEIDWSAAFDHKGWVGVPGVMTGLKRSGCNELYCIEMAESANLARGDCKVANWWSSFDRQGWSMCPDGYYMAGLMRNSCHKLYCVEEAFCCKQALSSGYAGACKDGNWWNSFDREGWSKCPDGHAMTGLYRTSGHELFNLEAAKCCPYKVSYAV